MGVFLSCSTDEYHRQSTKEKKETFVLAGKLINVMPLMTIIFGVFDLI